MELTKVAGVEGDLLGSYRNDKVAKARRDTLGKYRKLEQEEGTFEAEFPILDAEGNLRVEEDGVRLVLPAGEIEAITEDMNIKGTALTLYKYRVSVSHIDTANGVVYLKFNNGVSAVRDKYIKAIDESLSKGEKFCARARVEYVKYTQGVNRVTLNIAGARIPGFVNLVDWSKSYLPTLEGIVKRGDIVTVVVTEKYNKGGKVLYKCSRKLALDDAIWSGIEERYPEKSIVRIKCIQKRKNSFFGQIEGLKDIEVFCEYPSSNVDQQGKPLIITPGGLYQGYIYRVSEERKMLKARILYQITN